MTTRPPLGITRRRFVGGAGGCAAYLALSSARWPAARRFAGRARGRVVRESAFARVEELGDGVWAIVSTPLHDGARHFETTCNGGLVLGDDALLAIEAYYSTEGAAWVAKVARELTGRAPTHALLTHFHADHCRGLAAFDGTEPIAAHATATTRRLLAEDPEQRRLPDGDLDDEVTSTLDLGGRSVTITGRLGHTPSDLTVRSSEPDVLWCGDLVWNGMFPNYRDAIPSQLTRQCERMLGRPGVLYVPGHGGLADARELAPYLELLREVEAAARRAFEHGREAAAAAAEYAVPAELGEWVLFSPRYYEVAFAAWYREWDRAGRP